MAKKTVWLPYDMDTAIGINNEGALVFSYDLEDIDHTSGGAEVYNGQESVLWKNVREAYSDELKEMYKSLRSTGALSYEKVEKMFEEHQRKWCEAIFNEDAQFKYLDPLINDGNASYLSMLQGSKAEQRKWWLWNRFRYLDSKYNAGDALTEVITIRGYAKSNVTVTPYASIYAAVKYGSYLTQQRAARNVPVTLECPLDKVNDTEIYIYSADQIADVGDLSGFKMGYGDFSHAVKLVNLKIGDSNEGYSNGNLTELYLGNNELLRTLDVRNCPNLRAPIDISGCTNIEEVYFDGTSITGVTLPDGGVLKKLHLPSTVANLIIKNQPNLTELTHGNPSNISTLVLNNAGSTVDALSLASQMQNGGRVSITGINKTYTDDSEFSIFMSKMISMRGIDVNGNTTQYAYLEGEVTVNEISRYAYDNLYRFPYLTVHYTTIGEYEYVLYLQDSTKFTVFDDDVITNINKEAFAGSKLKICNAPNVITVGESAFNKSSLTEVHLKNATTIGKSAFYQCYYLNTVDLPNAETLGDSVFAQGNGGKIFLPKVTKIGASFCQQNVNVKGVVLPSVTSFGQTAFHMAQKLEFLDFGEALGTMPTGYGANYNLRLIILRNPNKVVKLTDTSLWNMTPFASGSSGGTVYIPKALYDELGTGSSLDYKAATNWSTVDGYGTVTWAQIEGSKYETEYADGTPIETEVE